MPAELALLPMIESDYMPRGDSDKGAVGLWQLMPDTAHDYGVKMNHWYDGRRSTIASTKVALSFLNYLYQMFNHNWLLALAAYNAGPGTVMSAIHYNKEHGRPTNFWALSLPKQTEEYIPKLLALAEIIQHPRTYGVHLSPVPNQQVTSTVTIKKQMPIKTIATLAHTTVNNVKKLNPALKRSVTPPHQVLTLVLPAKTQPEFVKHMAGKQVIVSAEKPVKTTAAAEPIVDHYTVKHGDSLSSIANKFKTSVENLEKLNRFENGLIHINQDILVPTLIVDASEDIESDLALKPTYKVVPVKTAKNQPTPTTAPAKPAAPVVAAQKPKTDVVKHSEKSVVQHNHETTAKKSDSESTKEVILAKAHDSHHDKVSHPAKKPVDHQKRSHHHSDYIVRHGDNLRVIARKHHTTIAKLMHENHLRHATLQIGQHLKLS